MLFSPFLHTDDISPCLPFHSNQLATNADVHRDHRHRAATAYRLTFLLSS